MGKQVEYLFRMSIRSSRTDTWKITLWHISEFFPTFPSSKFTLIQSFVIGDWIIWRWDSIHLLRGYFTPSLIFESLYGVLHMIKKNNIFSFQCPLFYHNITNFPIWNTKLLVPAQHVQFFYAWSHFRSPHNGQANLSCYFSIILKF